MNDLKAKTTKTTKTAAKKSEVKTETGSTRNPLTSEGENTMEKVATIGATPSTPVLKVDPTASVLITVQVGKLLANPFRDMTMFPIQEKKIESLIESIEKTGFWPSIMARPKNNMIDGKVISQTELTKLIAAGYDFSDVEWEKAFAHHRQVACERMGFSVLPIIPQIISDENMLLMMANENKAGFGSNINSQLETVRQVQVRLENLIADYDTYEDYLKDAGDTPFFATAKSFLNAQTQGIGFKTIRRFLGETWSDRDVRGPVAVLKAINDGLFRQEEIVNVPSIGLLEGIASIARTLYEGHTPQKEGAEPVPAPDWPIFFKQEAMAAVLERCQLDPSKGKNEATVTVTNLEAARAALQKEGVNPASFLRAGKGKTKFDVYEATKEFCLIADAALEKNLAAIEELKNHEGFMDWPGLPDLCLKLVAAANRMAAGLETGEEAGTADGGVVDGGEDLDKAVNTGEMGGEGDFGDTEGGTVSVDRMIITVATDAEIMSGRIDQFLPFAATTPVDDTFKESVGNLLNKVAKLAFTTMGKAALVEAFNSATAVE